VYRLPVAAICALLGAIAAPAQSPGRQPVGMSWGVGEYAVERTPVRGSATLLDGEGISTSQFAVELDLDDGFRGVLGQGSAARVAGRRVELTGVSLEAVRFGNGWVVAVGPVEARALTADARASFFSDREGEISLFVSKGEIEIAVDGHEFEPSRLSAGSVGFVAIDGGQARLLGSRAAVEIARIQLRQIDLLQRVEHLQPGLAKERARLVEELVESSGGLIDPIEAVHGGIVRVPFLDTPVTELIQAIRLVHARLNSRGLSTVGCGDPRCATWDRPVRFDRFGGWTSGESIGGVGCLLCSGPSVTASGSEAVQPQP
jgi:hypothetical protein